MNIEIRQTCNVEDEVSKMGKESKGMERSC